MVSNEFEQLLLCEAVRVCAHSSCTPAHAKEKRWRLKGRRSLPNFRSCWTTYYRNKHPCIRVTVGICYNMYIQNTNKFEHTTSQVFDWYLHGVHKTKTMVLNIWYGWVCVSLSLFEVAGDKGKNEFVITANLRRLCCMQTSSTAYVCIVVEFMILENTCIKCWI